ncbi:hypothetical protein BD413DRAFT_602174 [Trametes elegans]|nr:hypothetical protein BD413DRAFT_602174 [Trametes elegans]
MDPQRAASLSYDVLILILDWLEDSYDSLVSCSLVNRTFREASAAYLYRRVTYSPAYSVVLDLKRRDDFLDGFFASARLPHNAAQVRYLEVSGYLSTRPPPFNKFSDHLRSGIECWKNINSVIFTPRRFCEDVLTDSLSLLSTLSCLRHLTINTSCTGEKQVQHVVQLRDLESLTIESPTRAVLQVLPDWLGELQSSLRAFRLTNGCGSVTPGVLRSFTPHLQRVTTFALGLSYSLTDTDVFEFLATLPCLRTLEYRYYMQLRPYVAPPLRTLRNLTVRYWNVTTTRETNYLCTWVRRAITNASLEVLRLVCDNDVFGPAVSFGPLAEHLVYKHTERLRVLDMRDCFLGIEVLKELCRTCTNLEDLSLSISREALLDLPSFLGTLERLHTATFHIRHCKGPVDVSQDFAELLITSARRLRRLTIDKRRFEARLSR